MPVVLLVGLAGFWTTIRDYFVNISPQLIEILTFGRDSLAGSLILLGVMAALGLLGAAIHLIPQRTRWPIVNVNNNCSTGSTALYLARQAVSLGDADCVLALGFEQMQAGALKSHWDDRPRTRARFQSFQMLL